ncbi:MAG: nucleotidyltransferase family protein [Desulfovibrio sp.]|jgi:hypothetical protein|nr:nucleotidyltransferase family protein [Desulfovibrio sp.]
MRDFSMRRVIAVFRDQYVTPADRVLLNTVFADGPTQESLDECMRVCDIESLGAGKCILLSYLLHDHPELRLSDSDGPRVNGLITYFRFANMKVLAHFSKTGKAFNRAGIPMLLFKGAAMKVLRPDLSRPMGDVDVLVPKARMDEAVRICEGLGYLHYREESRHGVDFHTEAESAVDVHHSLFDPPGDARAFQDNLFARAAPRRAFGVDFLLPCREDLCFLVMTNFTKNLREHTTLGGLYYALCDCRFLQKDKKDFDWAIVRKNAADSGKELEVRFAAEFMNAVVPGTVPDADRRLPAGRDMEDFCNRIVFEEEYLRKRQRACQAIRVVDLKNRPWHFGKRILKFLLMKKLRRVPAFVRWYLETRGGEARNAH